VQKHIEGDRVAGVTREFALYRVASV